MSQLRRTAMVGGLAEYSSMLLGFQYVVLVAILFYTISAIGLKRNETVDENVVVRAVAES